MFSDKSFFFFFNGKLLYIYIYKTRFTWFMFNLVGPINLYIDAITNREYSPAKKKKKK